MERRTLGRAGPMLSVIGFGTWAAGGPDWVFGWGPQDDDVSIAAIHRALDLGVNWIDTAAVYGLGHAEEVIAKAVLSMAERPYIATKCGQVWDAQGHTRRDIRPHVIRSDVEASLRRLRVDVIDLYQIHWPDGVTPVEDAWLAMAAIQDAGKVRWIGVSNFDIPMLDRCLRIRQVDSLQPPYSLLRRRAEQHLIPFCDKQGIGVIVYSPLQHGLLTGRFDLSRLAPGDWRLNSPRFEQVLLECNLGFVERLRAIAARHKKTVSQLAIAWVLRDQAVTSAIVGARRAEQIDENVGGADWHLDDNALRAIGDALDATKATVE